VGWIGFESVSQSVPWAKANTVDRKETKRKKVEPYKGKEMTVIVATVSTGDIKLLLNTVRPVWQQCTTMNVYTVELS